MTLDDLLALYRGPAAQTRYDESVTELEHALQTAALAHEDGADNALVAAALLHDVGHLILRDHQPMDEELTVDRRHQEAGADALEVVFGSVVAEPVRHHVEAKRYLCAVDPAYHDLLSPASIRSLAVQGGPMTSDEAAVFDQAPHTEGAVRLRRWDDEAKVEGKRVPDLAHWRPMLEALVATRRAT